VLQQVRLYAHVYCCWEVEVIMSEQGWKRSRVRG